MNRFDFTPDSSGFPQWTTRLSSYADVRRWLPTPNQNALVYRVAVTSSVFASADILTQGHYTSESGTFLLPADGGKPTELGMEWNAFQSLVWLPDTSGLLRLGPANSPSVESDSTIDDGQGVTLLDPAASSSIFWLRLDGAGGALTDLTPYLGDGFHLSSSSTVELPKIWAGSN